MIYKLDVENFKCFPKETFEFTKFNILIGDNGSGKSSMIQPLLLMRQAFYNSKITLFHRMPMNGELVRLQSFEHVANDSKNPEINFWFDYEAVPFQERFSMNVFRHYMQDALSAMDISGHWSYTTKDTDSLKVSLRPKHGDLCAFLDDSDDYADVGQNLFVSGFPFAGSVIDDENSEFGFRMPFIYLGADRIGPASAIPVSSAREKMNPIKHDGSGTLQELFPYNPGHSFNEPQEYYLLELFNESFEKVFPGFGLTMRVQEGIDGRSYIVPLFEEISTNQTICPHMTGFGMFHSIPVIAAPILADGNATIIIENPEANLHPSAQTALGFVLASECKNNTQFFVETHSEYFIKGVKKAIASGNLSHESVSIHHFSKKSVDTSPIYKRMSARFRMREVFPTT